MKLLRDAVAGQETLAANPGDTVQSACETMARAGVGSILVLEAGSIVGIFTERDLLTRVVAKRSDPQTTLLRGAMTPNPTTLDGSETTREALAVMGLHGWRHMPVTDEAGHPLGMLSIRDAILEALGDD